jgi:hypothetical protein
MATNGMDSLSNNKPPRKAKSNPIIYKKEKPSMSPAMSTDRKSYKVSENVTVKARKDGMSKVAGFEGPGPMLKGAAQAVRQNVRAATPMSKSESKANARGLKAANASKKSPSALSQKIAKKMYPAGVPKMGKK